MVRPFGRLMVLSQVEAQAHRMSVIRHCFYLFHLPFDKLPSGLSLRVEDRAVSKVEPLGKISLAFSHF
jgi:hypothetical protein